jgi:hypothetical protein
VSEEVVAVAASRARALLRFATTQVYVKRDGAGLYLAGHTAALPTS